MDDNDETEQGEWDSYYCPDCNEEGIETIMETRVDEFGIYAEYYCPIHDETYTSRSDERLDDSLLVE